MKLEDADICVCGNCGSTALSQLVRCHACGMVLRPTLWAVDGAADGSGTRKSPEALENFFIGELEPELKSLGVPTRHAPSKPIASSAFVTPAVRFLGFFASMVCVFFASFLLIVGALALLGLQLAGGPGFLLCALGGMLIWFTWFGKYAMSQSQRWGLTRRNPLQEPESRLAFKQRVVRPLVRFINPGFVYDPGPRDATEGFNECGLFGHAHRATSEDIVTGVLDGVAFSYCELKAQTFQGIFFRAQFNKRLKSRTFLHLDFIDRLLEPASIAGKGKLIRLENPAFERMFRVYGDDPVEARYILTHTMMERLVQYMRGAGQPLIDIAFLQSHIVVTISRKQDLFEPDEVVGFPEVVRFYEDLMIPLAILKELELNKRIWPSDHP